MVPEQRIERQWIHDARVGQAVGIVGPCFHFVGGLILAGFREPAGLRG